MTKHFIIIGAGQAAAQAVQTLRQNEFSGEISMIGAEPYLPYQRPPLSKKYLAGELAAERLFLRPEQFYADRNITVEKGVQATSINLRKRQLCLNDNRILGYDGLMLATGGRVRRLAVPGSDLKGIHYVRTISDVDALRADLLEGKKLVTVGGGYIGLEIAAVARSLGAEVTVLEAQDRVLARVVCPEVSAFYSNYHANAGVKIQCGTAVSGFIGQERVTEVETTAGKTIACDLVVVGIGIEPEVELAKKSGLLCANGIVVDEYAQTSDARVVAAGDCTAHPSIYDAGLVRLESVHNAIEQAKTAALSLLAKPQAYHQVPWFWSDQFDLKLQIAGLSTGYEEVVLRGDPTTKQFSACYLRDEVLIALDAINSPRDFMFGKILIAAGAKIQPQKLADTEIGLDELVAGSS
jgi:3-phenylpropionate/trans-cinnamate dioxygenase ferredoxin reductase component